jgi:hypothetical protein
MTNKSEMNGEGQHFECECRNVEHTLVVRYVSLPEPKPEIEMTVFIGLNSDGLLRRIRAAIRHVLGYRSDYGRLGHFGHFGHFRMKKEDADRMVELLQRYRADMEKQQEAWNAEERP